MSIEVMTLVFKRSLGCVTRKAVLLAMADAANDDGSGVWKSAQTIANQCDLSKRTVLRTWEGLEADGLIRRCGERLERGGKVIIWAVDVGAISRLKRSSEPGDKMSSGRQKPDVTVSPGDTQTPGDTVSPGDRLSPHPVTLCPKPGDTVSPKPIDNRPKPSRAESFEVAWKRYGSTRLKANQTRKAAKAAWPAAVKRAGSEERILAAIQLEIDARENPPGFIRNLPDMHRWLRGDQWEDAERQYAPPEPTTPAQPVSIPRAAWQRALRSFFEAGTWSEAVYGPRPGEAGCKAPPDLVASASVQDRERAV